MDYVDIRRGPIYMVTGSRSQTGKTGKKENGEDIALYTVYHELLPCVNST
jgi:hypothetical protein